MTATIHTQSGRQRLARKQRLVAEAIAEELGVLAERADRSANTSRYWAGARAYQAVAASLRLRAAELQAEAGTRVTS